ncbi:MAG TPA: methylated-DNA--[protein]-cysteine S-methyltransferase, partial [Thermoanaerobaculia bacterium]|nr:methylated-DNA--[protein]-cysteine S-methyltransferase [Thermoanaerobaculia bacterium]
MLDEQQCWQALIDRDSNWDGRFFFGVLTTGVYCRPSCAARRPLRQNVRFYATSAEAERDGLRPCLRCRPLEAPRAKAMADLCDYIRAHCEGGEPLTLEVLAKVAGLSPTHLQRTFRAVVGVSPRSFVEACRLEALKRELRAGAPVTDAIYEAGFGSASRVYERTDSHLGMTPLEFRSGGRGLVVSHAVAATPFGLLMVAGTDRGLCFVEFGDSPEELLERLRRQLPAAHLEPVAAPYPKPFQEWISALTRHLAGEQPSLDLPLALRATAFQLKVWRYLQSIPRGEVRSYSQVAEAIGRPGAARAVARACASNRAALAIPCHR